MNRQLEILSRYLPYEVEVQTFSGYKGVLDCLDFLDNEHPIAVGNLLTDEAKPILRTFDQMNEEEAVHVAGLAVPHIVDWAEVAYEGKHTDVYSAECDWVISIFRDFDVRVYKGNESPRTYHQAQIQQYFISRLFAVGLAEGEFIRKEE